MDRRTARLTLSSLSVGFALVAFPVLAGDGDWIIAGSPDGGYVGKVIVDPSTPTTLYAMSTPGVFKSTDSGADWHVILPALGQPSDLVIDPLHSSTLYVSSGASQGVATVRKSTDGGATWSDADDGIGMIEDGSEPDAIGGLAVDPVNEGVVYASSGNTGLYKSTDGGAHWSKIDTGLTSLLATAPDYFLSTIVVDPADPQVLYFGAEVTGVNGGFFADHAESGLYQSTDGGAHWTQRIDHMGVSRVTVDPSHDQTVYATGLGLYASTDGGAHWAADTSMNISNIMAVDPNDSQHMWGNYFSGNLYETTDGGANWNPAGPGGTVDTNGVALDPVTPANLYLSTNWGIFSTTDGGVTWADSTTGIHSVVVDSMMEGPDGIVYMASGGTGIYKSFDQGVTWTQVGAASGPTGSLPAMGISVEHMAEDPTASTTLYAGTDGGIFKSIDGGDSWTEADAGIPAPAQTLYLAVDPEAPATLYAATNEQGVGLYKSIDGGASWTAAANGIHYDPAEGGLMAVAVDPHDSDVVYAGAFHTGLFKSVDGGATWQEDNGAIGVTDIWSIAVDPSDSNIVYTATSNGFFKSTDAGATWTESDWGLCGNFLMTDIQFDPSDSSILYVTQRYGLGDAFVSPDAGYTWYDMSTLAPLCVDQASTQQAKPMQRKAARGTQSFQPGHGGRTEQSAGTHWSIRAAAIGAGHTRILGGGSDGKVYTFDVRKLPKPPAHTPSGGGGGGGSTGGGSNGGGQTGGSLSGSGGGGGGDLSLLVLFGLAGFAALRRKR